MMTIPMLGLPFIGIALLMGASSPALAGGDYPIKGGDTGGQPSIGVSAVAPNQAVNSQQSSGVVNQSPMGGIFHNTQMNNGQDTSLGFGPGIHCRGPNLSIGLSGSHAGTHGYNSSAFGGAVSLSIPLGNAADRACKQLAAEIVRQRQTDTALTLVKQCAELVKLNISFDDTVPEFAMLKPCQRVNLTTVTQQVTIVQPPAKPKPKPSSQPEPIRGLW